MSPDGTRLAWLTWNHPDMPWVAAEAWVGAVQADGTVAEARRVAGGPDELVFQPSWSPDGELYFVSDRGSGWWNLYRERDGAIEPLAPMEAEFGQAQWNFAMSTYAFDGAERIVCCFTRDGVWRLARLDPGTRRFDVMALPFTSLGQLRAGAGRAVFLAGSPTEPSALVELDLATGTHRIIRRSAVLGDEVRPYVSVARPITFPTAGGETAHALYYPPLSPAFTAPAGEKAPVLVKSHGGPTASASSTLSLGVQYWTSRGIGVLDVNYRGSTGYGRPYRLRLARQWGLLDVEDCVHGARHLVETEGADPARLMISGGSAGGYTTLCALTAAGEADVQRGRQLLRRERPGGPGARHPQVRSALPRLAHRSLSAGREDLCRALADQPPRSPRRAGDLLPGGGGQGRSAQPDGADGRRAEEPRTSRWDTSSSRANSTASARPRTSSAPWMRNCIFTPPSSCVRD